MMKAMVEDLLASLGLSDSPHMYARYLLDGVQANPYQMTKVGNPAAAASVPHERP